MPNLCIQHDAGCLPVSSAWCHQTRVFSLTIIKEIIPFTSRPSAQGGFTMQKFSNTSIIRPATTD